MVKFLVGTTLCLFIVLGAGSHQPVEDTPAAIAPAVTQAQAPIARREPASEIASAVMPEPVPIALEPTQAPLQTRAVGAILDFFKPLIWFLGINAVLLAALFGELFWMRKLLRERRAARAELGWETHHGKGIA